MDLNDEERAHYRAKAMEGCARLLNLLKIKAPAPIVANEFVLLEERVELVSGKYLGSVRYERAKRRMRLDCWRCTNCGTQMTSERASTEALCEGCTREIDKMIQRSEG